MTHVDVLKPSYCVWELTLACNQRCGHCGSRAGTPRPDELNTEECLQVVQSLAKLGCEVITLSGGEPTLRSDWYAIAREIQIRLTPQEEARLASTREVDPKAHEAVLVGR